MSVSTSLPSTKELSAFPRFLFFLCLCSCIAYTLMKFSGVLKYVCLLIENINYILLFYFTYLLSWTEQLKLNSNFRNACFWRYLQPIWHTHSKEGWKISTPLSYINSQRVNPFRQLPPLPSTVYFRWASSSCCPNPELTSHSAYTTFALSRNVWGDW